MSSSGTSSVSPVPSAFELGHSSSGASRTRNSSTSRPRPRGVRTNIACKACQKRKTKCSGGPSPCELCTKFATHCHFNPKLDTRRKVSYKSSEKHDIRGYILESTLQVLKKGNSESVENLLRTIRSDASSVEDIARSFQQNFKQLQHKNVIPPFKIDESDIISLALQGLFPYRIGGAQAEEDSDTETVHVPQSSPSRQNQPYCDFPTETYGMRSAQQNQRFQDFVRRSPVSNGRAVANGAIAPNSGFNTAYSSFSEESFDFPPTPLAHSPHFYFDGGGAAHSHHQLTPYSSHDPHHHSNGHSHSFQSTVPVLVSQPLLDKSHLDQNVQPLPSWPQNIPLNTQNMSWQQPSHGALTSPAAPVQLVSHHEPIYNNWSS